MAITLGTFSKQDNGTFTGTLEDPQRHRGADHRPGREALPTTPRTTGLCWPAIRGWCWLEPGRQTSGETYVNLKIAAPEFGPNWVRFRLVKLENAAEDGATHIALWEPRDR